VTGRDWAFLAGFGACLAMDMLWAFGRGLVVGWRNARALCDVCADPATTHMRSGRITVHACAEHVDPVAQDLAERVLAARAVTR
jgi:hypothetical protein